MRWEGLHIIPYWWLLSTGSRMRRPCPDDSTAGKRNIDGFINPWENLHWGIIILLTLHVVEHQACQKSLAGNRWRWRHTQCLDFICATFWSSPYHHVLEQEIRLPYRFHWWPYHVTHLQWHRWNDILPAQISWPDIGAYIYLRSKCRKRPPLFFWHYM